MTDILRRLIQHPSPAVQSAAAWALRSFVLVAPGLIESALVSCKSDVEQNLNLLRDTVSPHSRVALGVAQGLAVVVQVCPIRPLYYSANLISDIWNLAITLLQLSGKSDIRISQVQIQVAWILIGALMSIGAHFIKSHLSQLLLLWQNALPRSIPREVIVSRSTAELQYLLHVRERSLAALHLFLLYNGKTITYDISKRITSMLSDTVIFVGRLPLPTPTDEARLLASQVQLTETISKIRTSVFRCYSALSLCDQRYSAGPEILMAAISIFAEPDHGGVKSGTSGRAPSSGTFESLSSIEDNYSFGVSGYLKKLTIPADISRRDHGQIRHWSIWSTDSDLLDDIVIRSRPSSNCDR